VMEDALTLTFMLIVLATLGDGDGLADYRTLIGAWVAYKTLRLTWQLLVVTTTWEQQVETEHVDHPYTPDHHQQMKIKQQKLQQLLQSSSIIETAFSSDDSSQSTVESESSVSASTSTSISISTLPDDNTKINNVTTSTDNDTETWIIHGAEYRLQDYVARHPGGLEAIMLGRGRDCTALYESYHPFTNKHKVVLEKYRVAASSASSQTDTLQNKYRGSSTDHFYEVLCQRVAQTLTEKGIHPVKDRCATVTRTLYYGLVLVALTISGISHVKVR
jgi:cytochrome b involved in lipid metabolism